MITVKKILFSIQRTTEWYEYKTTPKDGTGTLHSIIGQADFKELDRSHDLGIATDTVRLKKEISTLKQPAAQNVLCMSEPI